MIGFGPIYDPDDAENLIEMYLQHGDLMGWGDKPSSSDQDEEDCGEEARDDD